MNIDDQIKDWINSIEKDFYSGLSLLQKICRNKVLTMNLGKKETPKNLEKINYELGKYLNVEYKPINAPEVIQKPVAKPIATKLIEETDYDIKLLPDPVQKLFIQKRGFYLERNKLSQQVQDETKGQTVIPKSVQELVKSILELDEMIKAVDSKVEYYWRYGALPIDSKTPVDDQQKKITLEEIRKKIKNQNTYVTKARQRFEKNPENLRYAEELQKKLYDLKELQYQRDALSISTSSVEIPNPA
jgi:hypothetical protein